MLKVRFYSDANIDGFVQLIAQLGVEHTVDLDTRMVEVEDDPMVRTLADDWGGLIEDV